MELIHNKFKETLRAKGLEEMEVKEGDTFDAEIHEAITQIPAPSDKLKGKIVDVVEKGYKLGDTYHSLSKSGNRQIVYNSKFQNNNNSQ